MLSKVLNRIKSVFAPKTKIEEKPNKAKRGRPKKVKLDTKIDKPIEVVPAEKPLKKPQHKGYHLSRAETMKLIGEVEKDLAKGTSKGVAYKKAGVNYSITSARVSQIMGQWATGFYSKPPSKMKRMTKEEYEKAKDMSIVHVPIEEIARTIGVDEERVSEALKKENYNKFRQSRDS